MITADARFRHVVFADRLKLPVETLDFADPPAINRPDPLLRSEDAAFVGWLLGQAGISQHHYRAETLARRLPACLRATHAKSASQARSIIDRNDSMLHTAVSAMIIGVSSFFRDPAVFDVIEERVLPHLIEQQKSRIWSIGCSEGAELYSIAMLLAEMGALDRCQLLGTDCRLHAIQAASAARYPAMPTERDVPPTLLSQYFQFDGAKNQYSIVADLRKQLHWRRADVLRVQEPGPWDLILCRNMAMYMRGEITAMLWRMFERSLRPGGYVVLGKVERPDGASWLSCIAPCVYRRDRG